MVRVVHEFSTQIHCQPLVSRDTRYLLSFFFFLYSAPVNARITSHRKSTYTNNPYIETYVKEEKKKITRETIRMYIKCVCICDVRYLN